MSSPSYPAVETTALATIAARLTHNRRSFHSDAVRLCAMVRPPIQYIGFEALSGAQPLLITANHYARPGFSTAWIALAISAPFPAEVSWIISNQWLFEGSPLAFILRPVMRFVLKSITLTYRFLPMPTMTSGFSTPQERTAGVRAVIERMRQEPNCILGLTPEGMDSPEDGLGLPPPGAGRFILHLQQMGTRLLPVGIKESGGQLQVHFGQPYQLDIPETLPPSELDLAIRQEVMQHIQRLID